MITVQLVDEVFQQSDYYYYSNTGIKAMKSAPHEKNG